MTKTDRETSDSDGALNPAEVLRQLMAVVESRRDNPPERSYTTSLFQGGVEKIGAKILEEAQEVVEAGVELDAAEDSGRDVIAQKERHHLVYEAADLIYHLFVLLGHKNIRLCELTDELARRFGTSGLDEKASRSNENQKGSG